MKGIKIIGSVLLFALFSIAQSLCQNALQFTSAIATPEKNIQLHWASNTNEIYEIDYANELATNDDGSTAWFPLIADYPAHQGSNTFWLDTGDYNNSTTVPRPKDSAMRFYRVVLTGTNTDPVNPTVAITSPSNGNVVSSNLIVSFSAGCADSLASVKLYVDGQEMPPSDNGSNFVINTCEWWNGAHVLFVTAESLSHFEGIPNDTSVTYGHAVSSYMTLNFSNLISEVAFSQPYFEPSLGETQEVTADFAANCNWTLQILDVYGNAVRTQTGSGNWLSYDWDGTGTGGTNIPDAVYTFFISAATNGLADELVTSGGDSGTNSTPPGPDDAMLWAAGPGDSDALVPLALIPPGADTNDLTIFSATPSEVRALRVGSVRSPTSLTRTTLSGGGHFTPMGVGAAGNGQSTVTPIRPPTIKGKGTVGTFYAGYQNYYTPSGYFSAAPIATGNPIVNKWVQVDGESSQSAASHSEPFGTMYENADIANGFATAMKGGRWQGSVNSFVTASQVTGGVFNNANVGLLCCHASYGTTAESDGVTRSYLRFLSTYGGGATYCRLDDCNFGASGTNGLKYMAILACSVLYSSDYNSLHEYGRLPISEDLHLLLTTSTVATAAPTLGSRWANFMLGDGTTNVPPESVEQSWFDAGRAAYDNSNGMGETNHITITYRVAGWPDAFTEHLSDANGSPGTGNVLDITKADSTVFSNP